MSNIEIITNNIHVDYHISRWFIETTHAPGGLDKLPMLQTGFTNYPCSRRAREIYLLMSANSIGDADHIASTYLGFVLRVDRIGRW